MLKLYFFSILFFITFSYSQKSLQTEFEKGIAFYNKNELDSALVYFKKIEKNKSKAEQFLKLPIYIGNILKLKQEYQEALLYYKFAENKYVKLKKYDLLTDLYTSLAEFYRSKFDYKIANNYILKAEKLLKTVKVPLSTQAYFWNRKASIVIEHEKDIPKTLYCSEKVIEIAKQLKNENLLASTYNEIGYCYENIPSFKAESYYLKAISLFKKNNNYLDLSNVYINLIRFYHKNKILDKRKIILDEAYQISFKKQDEISLKYIYEQYHLYYLDCKEYKKALEFHKKFHTLDKKELINKWDKQLIEAEKKYELKSKNKELELNELKFKNKEIENEQNKKTKITFIALFLIALVGLVLIIYQLNKIRYKNKKLNKLYETNAFLLNETNHRINNNLQLIIVLISEELKKKNEQNNEVLAKLLSKVESISTLHRQLYQTTNKEEINLKIYLNEIIKNFDGILNEKNILTEKNFEDVNINSDMALYFGLILTELLINSIKYSFDKAQVKLININLIKLNNILKFTFKDNGLLAVGAAIQPKLIDKLCRQIKIDYKINTNEGFEFKIEKKI